MPSSHVQPSAAAAAAPSPQATLDALAHGAAEHAGKELAAMAARLAAALADVDGCGSDGAALDTRAVYQRVKSARLLKENAYAFCHLATGAVGDALRAELARLRPQGTAPAVPDTLSLVPLEEIDDRLAIAALARPFDLVHAEALATLAVRLGMLVGRGMLRPDANPFRPAVFLQAIDAAWRAFEPDALAYKLVRPLLVPDVMFDFGPMLDALAARLREAHHRPGRGAGYHIQKTDDAAAAQAARAGRQAALSAQLRALFGEEGMHADVALVPDLPDMPAGSGGWRPSAAAGFQAPASAPAVQSGAAGVVLPSSAPATVPTTVPAADLLARLASLAAADVAGEAVQAAVPHNVFYLPRLKRDLPAGALARADERTLELLSRVFETVLLDDSIPPQARELLQLLQLPVLKAALLDRDFFFEQAHPARRLVDLLSRMGWEQRTDSADPVFRAMRRGVHAVEAAARADQDAQADGAAFASSFATAVAELEAQIEAGREAEESALQAAIAGPVASALARERQETAARAAQEAVALRLAAAGVPDVVDGFLGRRWTTVMTFAYSIEDARPGAVGDATRAMDDLVWSVKPKPTQEQRKSLIARLPRLLATLNKWLDAIKWQDAERLQFFAALAECHAAIVRAPLELTPERQMELAVEAARLDALRRIEHEQAAREQVAEEAAQRAAAWSPLDGLERGTWLELSGADGARKVKLAWVSPLRTLFIFSGVHRREAFSLTADKLAAALHAGRARVLALDGVVGQVLAEAMREGAVNDARAGALQA
nr:DUF1631 family protein [uncultured Massilia sp.]